MAITKGKIKQLEYETSRLHGERIFTCYFYGVTGTYFFKKPDGLREYQNTETLSADNGITEGDILVSLVAYTHPAEEPYRLPC